MAFSDLLEDVAKAFEAIGAAVLVIGLAWSVVLAAGRWRAAGGRSGYQALRETFGAVLLLGLEILVAADLIRTVAVSPTLENVAVLGLIVLIRTFLSVSLEVEIEGELPWRRALASGLTVGKRPRSPRPQDAARGNEGDARTCELPRKPDPGGRVAASSSTRFRPRRAP
jgi:uncharacterized membrane protein